ncbi:MAG: putative toxin-antitoxin system toxin component, PIN family [Symbiobacteriaceae bacterium]|nr:putative toxin-antitoxin system toxin component, PIN family [Symbiobacteriaceae bacterium]
MINRVVLDTNILVSALWSANGNEARLLRMFIDGEILICYCTQMLIEYKNVLRRPRLSLNEAMVNIVLHYIRDEGFLVEVIPSEIPFRDESDRKFFDVAIACEAILITGNRKHFPDHPAIMSTTQYLAVIVQ